MSKDGSKKSNLSGFSFKALEEEEDKDDLTSFTGKFDKLLDDSHRNKSVGEIFPGVQRSSPPRSSDTKIQKLRTSSLSLDDELMSPSKKGKSSVFEYKELISGLKEKITDTKVKITGSINKKLEELSNDSSPSCENSSRIILDAPINHPLDDSIVEKLNKSQEEEFQNEHYERVQSAPAALAETVGKEYEDDGIEVVESYFGDETLEDISGDVGICLRGTAAHTKSKKLGKKNKPKSSATVSMSKLISTPEEEEEVQREFSSSNMEKKIISDEDNNGTKSSSANNKLSRQNSQDISVPWQKIISIGIVLVAFLILPMPSFVSGLVIGVILSFGGWSAYLWVIQAPLPKETVELTPIHKLPPMEIPRMKEPTKESGVYKGWMNEILEYNPDDYHLNQTHSVYVVLEGTHLRLQRPKTNMPRRALWDEILPPPKFIHQRHLELKSSRIFLMPPGLVKKRVWSKKYPICIALDQEKLPVVKTKSNDSKKSTDDDSDFEIITEDKCSSNILYLFARTGWEKEVWFKRLQAASHGKPLQNHILDIYKALSITSRMSRNPSTSSLKHKRQSSNDSISSISSQPDQPPSPSQTTTSNTTSDDNPVNLQAFAEYMGRLMPSEKELKESATSKSSHFKHDSSDIRQVTGSLVCDPQLIWLNSLVGRCFWDLLQDEWWSEKIREKLQKKLSKIHVPYFIEELKVTHTEMGYEVPSIRRAGKPYIDEQGLWIDLDIVYNGGFYMTMETKINLMKLQKKSDEKLHKDDSGTYHSPVTDSNEEDSAESSTDEDEESQDTANDGSSGGAGKKVLKYIDKIANSKYFQQAYEYKYIKKAMEGVSNTPLELTVELNNLTGRLALNIPPPPTDRLWYGFRGNPILSLSAKPKVGERQVNISHITEWIEKKLSTEFQRVFVMPNMDDLVIPILLPGIPSDVIPDIPHSQSSTAV